MCVYFIICALCDVSYFLAFWFYVYSLAVIYLSVLVEPASELSLAVRSCEANGSVAFNSSGLITQLVYTCYNDSTDPASVSL